MGTPLTSSDMDDLRRTIMDAALLIAAAVIASTAGPRYAEKGFTSMALELLAEIREETR